SKATTRTREWCRGVARITSATCSCQPGRSVRTCIAVPLDLLVPRSKIFGPEVPEGGPTRSGAPKNTSGYRRQACGEPVSPRVQGVYYSSKQQGSSTTTQVEGVRGDRERRDPWVEVDLASGA